MLEATAETVEEAEPTERMIADEITSEKNPPENIEKKATGDAKTPLPKPKKPPNLPS